MATSGVLEISVIEATNLHSTDLLSRMDPYVEVGFAGVKQRTEVNINGDCNPKWQHPPLKFDVREGQHIATINVYNKNSVLADSFIGGNQSVNLANLIQTGGRQEVWVSIFQRGNHDSGRVHLVLVFTPTAKSPPASPPRTDDLELRKEVARLGRALAEMRMKNDKLQEQLRAATSDLARSHDVIAQKDRIIASLRARIDELTLQLEMGDSRVPQLLRERDQARAEAERLLAENNDLRDQLNKARAEIERLRAELNALKNKEPPPPTPTPPRAVPYIRDAILGPTITLESQGYVPPPSTVLYHPLRNDEIPQGYARYAGQGAPISPLQAGSRSPTRSPGGYLSPVETVAVPAHSALSSRAFPPDSLYQQAPNNTLVPSVRSSPYNLPPPPTSSGLYSQNSPFRSNYNPPQNDFGPYSGASNNSQPPSSNSYNNYPGTSNSSPNQPRALDPSLLNSSVSPSRNDLVSSPNYRQ